MLPFILPALIAGVGSVAATALQNSANRKAQSEQNFLNAQQADKQHQYNWEAMEKQREYDLEDRQFAIDNPTVIKGEVDYEKMVASAAAAGINPLTALRNGGSAGFSATSQPSAPLSRNVPVRQAPHQGVAAQQSALGAGIGSFIENFDPFAAQRREMEQQVVAAQIENLNAHTTSMLNPMRPRSFNVPTYTAGTIESRPSGAAAQLSKVVTGDPQAVVEGQPSVTNPWQKAKVDPRIRDAESFESRYGDSEIAQMLYGVYVGWGDLSKNVPEPPKVTDLYDIGYNWWQKKANDDYDKQNRRALGGGGGGW